MKFCFVFSSVTVVAVVFISESIGQFSILLAGKEIKLMSTMVVEMDNIRLFC